jgi:hypothetical protein
MRTVPVNQSAGPLLDGCEPLLLISILSPFFELKRCRVVRGESPEWRT